jgi:shikimate 5-dehydrogenase
MTSGGGGAAAAVGFSFAHPGATKITTSKRKTAKTGRVFLTDLEQDAEDCIPISFSPNK